MVPGCRNDDRNRSATGSLDGRQAFFQGRGNRRRVFLERASVFISSLIRWYRQLSARISDQEKSFRLWENQGLVALTQLPAKETEPLAPLRVPMRPSPYELMAHLIPKTPLLTFVVFGESKIPVSVSSPRLTPEFRNTNTPSPQLLSMVLEDTS